MSARVGCGRQREQRLRRDQLARDAEPALRGTRVEERLLERMQLTVGGEALDRRDAPTVGLDREDEARIDAHVIEQHGARAALADEAALLRAGQPEVVAQDLEERVVRLDLDAARAAVDGQLDGVAIAS